jgi:flagellar protein FlgJ
VDAIGPILPPPSTLAADALAEAAVRSTGGDKAQSAEQAAKDFESILLQRLLDSMKRTIPESGLLPGGITEQMNDIFWMYLSQELGRQGGLGLWKQLAARFQAAAEPDAPGEAPTLEPSP